MTLSDVQKALDDSRVLQELWITGVWEAMTQEPTDIYPLVEPDYEVNITITFSDKVYRVPLEDVSDIHPNDSITISLNDLYSDWEERIWNIISNESKVYSAFKDDWSISKYIGLDGKLRTVKVK